MVFPPEVERWRSLVAKYFPAYLVDKALWTIQHESGGNPTITGDGGVAIGLFQIQDNRAFSSRPNAAYLSNAENNIRYAAQQLGAANGDFSAWGENNTYNGQPFGAFGNNDWEGDSGGKTPIPKPPRTGDMSQPMPAWQQFAITQPYGPTSEELDSGYTDDQGVWHPHFNKGYDYGMPEGTGITAHLAGEVVAAGWGDDGWGYRVQIRDSNGLIHNFGHLSEVSVNAGDWVTPGQFIGFSGNTGASRGAHLSYDVWNESTGRFVDPATVLGGMIGGGGPAMPDAEYYEKFKRMKILEGKLNAWDELVTGWQTAVAIAQANPGTVMPSPPDPKGQPTPEEYAEYYQLAGEIEVLDAYYEQQGAGTSPSEIIAAYDFYNKNDPKVIDAMNSANRYAREYEARVQAASVAATEATRLQQQVADSINSKNDYYDRLAKGQMAAVPGVAPAKVSSIDELFASSLETIKAGLPEVTDVPYPVRPPLSAVLGQTGAGATPKPTFPTPPSVPTTAERAAQNRTNPRGGLPVSDQEAYPQFGPRSDITDSIGPEDARASTTKKKPTLAGSIMERQSPWKRGPRPGGYKPKVKPIYNSPEQERWQEFVGPQRGRR